MVEFALVFPIFLVIVMATIDFGWALRGYITLTNAAREGARLGVTGATSDAIKARTVETSSSIISTSNVTVTNAKGTPGSSVVVKVDYDYQYITPLGNLMNLISGGTIPSPLPMSTTTNMRLE